MHIEDIQDWIMLVGALHGLALAIANLTPTPKDNEILKTIYRAIEILAGIISPLAKR